MHAVQTRSYFRHPAASLLLALLAVANAMGCGSDDRELAPVTGTVTYRGEPLQFGSVVFEHEYGQPATAAIQPDGTFALATRGEGEGAVVGQCRVRVACYEGQDPARHTGPNPPNALGKSLIPEKYTSFETSGITVDIHSGTNEPVSLDLK